MFLELDLEPPIAERFANTPQVPPKDGTNLDPGLIFFPNIFYWQITQRFVVQDQAQETKGCPLNEFLNTKNLISL